MNRELFLNRALAIQPKLQALRRKLHKNPEVGTDTPFAKELVTNTLRSIGYDPEECGESGVTALAGCKKSGRCFLLRADMDALPITEETDVDYKSEIPGRMHACGHDNHVAMLLGAAMLLKEFEGEINGTVKLMFQAGEEIFAGAEDMVTAGVLENPHVDAAMMIHASTGRHVPKGTMLILGDGCRISSSDTFTVEVRGKGGHGAMPQEAVDPITIAAHIHSALGEINSRELAPGVMGVITAGVLSAGFAANVIPETAVIKGTLRTGSADIEEFIKKRITEICENISRAFRGDASVVFTNHCPPMIPDERLSRDVLGYLTEAYGKRAVPMSLFDPTSKILGGSEDFAFISREVPAVSLMLGMGGAEKEYSYPQHHPRAKFDDSVLHLGAGAYAYTAIRWLESNCSE